MTIAANRNTKHCMVKKMDVAMFHLFGISRSMALPTQVRIVTNSGFCQRMVVTTNTMAKPHQTPIEMRLLRKRPSIFGSGVLRSKIGVGLGVVCAAVASTGGKVQHGKNRLQ